MIVIIIKAGLLINNDNIKGQLFHPRNQGKIIEDLIQFSAKFLFVGLYIICNLFLTLKIQ